MTERLASFRGPRLTDLMTQPLRTPLTDPVLMTVNGARLIADPSGAAVWAEEGVLLVSDLHFEKGSAYAVRGQFLPPYDTRATLRKLAEAIAIYQPRRVVALGDSFHDLGADDRMAPEDADTLSEIVASVEDWLWIEGNHDPKPPERFGGRAGFELDLGPLHLRHEPQAGDHPGEVAGHLHPCAKISGQGRRVRRRCFATDGARLILPAFGAFTGGLNVCDAAYAPLFRERPHAYMLGRDRVYAVSGSRLLGD